MGPCLDAASFQLAYSSFRSAVRVCVCVCVYRGCEQGVCVQCWGVLFVLDSWMFSWYCLGVSENVTSCNVSANISE